MRTVIFFSLIGIFALQSTEGRPNDFSVDNEVTRMTQSLVKPLYDKKNEADEVLAKVWKSYNEKMEHVNNRISLLENRQINLESDSNATTPAPTPIPPSDSCQELKEAMTSAQKVSDEAALLALEVVADMSDVVITSKDCLTINIFSAASCAAHKIKDARDIYAKVQAQVNEVEERLAKSFQNVGKEFIACFKRVN